MLIVVPPSESKREPPEHGRPIDLERLSFPDLTQRRREVLEALVVTSTSPDALRRLHARPSHVLQVARNSWLAEVPAMPVLDVYIGPLHQGLAAATLSAAALEHAERDLVVVSPLWGALRPSDRIPPYRMHVCSRLVGLDRLEPAWRTLLPDVLAHAAGRDGVVVDLRSPMVQAMGMPRLPVDRTVTIRVDQGQRGHRIGDVVAKRIRGEAARHLLESESPPPDAQGVADVLGDYWPVRLEAPGQHGRWWMLTLTVDA